MTCRSRWSIETSAHTCSSLSSRSPIGAVRRSVSHPVTHSVSQLVSSDADSQNSLYHIENTLNVFIPHIIQKFLLFLFLGCVVNDFALFMWTSIVLIPPSHPTNPPHPLIDHPQAKYECRRAPLSLSTHTWFSSPSQSFISSFGSETAGLCRCRGESIIEWARVGGRDRVREGMFDAMSFLFS